MKDKNSIDDLFKDNLDDYEIAPSPRVWENIEKEHFGKKRFLLYRYGFLVAGLLLLILTGAYFIFRHDNIENGSVTNDEITVLPGKRVDNGKMKRNTETTDNNTVYEPEINKTVDDDKIKNEVENKVSEPVKEDFTEKNNYTNIINKGAGETTKENNVVQREYNVLNENNIGISGIQSRSLRFDLGYNAVLKPQPDFDNLLAGYMKKHAQFHIWTDVHASAYMDYYPQSKDMPGWSVGTGIGLKSNRFYMVSGIDYQFRQEEAVYSVDYESLDSVGYYYKVLSFEVNPANPEEITFKTQKTTVYDSIAHVDMVYPVFRYHYLNIPLTAGYRFYQRGNLAVAMEAGLIFSKLLSEEIPEVTLNNPEYKLLGITRQTPQRSLYNFQYIFALRINYYIKNRISLELNPRFTKYMDNIYESGDKVLPYSMGISAGICFDF